LHYFFTNFLLEIFKISKLIKQEFWNIKSLLVKIKVNEKKTTSNPKWLGKLIKCPTNEKMSKKSEQNNK